MKRKSQMDTKVLEINKGGLDRSLFFVKDVANTVDDSDIELDKMKTHIFRGGRN